MKPSELYVMDEHKQIRPATSYSEWKRAMLKTDCTVLRNPIGPDQVVHTFFVGYNLNPDPGGPPLMFKTVVTGVKYPKAHYHATFLDAWRGHALALTFLGDIAGEMSQSHLLVAYDGGKPKTRKPARSSEHPKIYRLLRSNEG